MVASTIFIIYWLFRLHVRNVRLVRYDARPYGHRPFSNKSIFDGALQSVQIHITVCATVYVCFSSMLFHNFLSFFFPSLNAFHHRVEMIDGKDTFVFAFYTDDLRFRLFILMFRFSFHLCEKKKEFLRSPLHLINV